MRITHSLIKVLDALMEDPTKPHWGYELSRRSGIRSGVLYPILARLLEAGLLTDGWEDQKETQGKRPPRRYYEVTGDGEKIMSEILRDAAEDTRFAQPIGRSV